MGELRDLWGVSDETLRTLIDSRRLSRPAPSASEELLGRSMLGDEAIPDAERTLLRAERIEVSPDAIWPWAAQMMRGGGIYGWAALETRQCASAEHLLEGVPPPRTGDRVDACFRIVLVEPGREIVWRAMDGVGIFNHTLKDLTLDYRIEPSQAGGATLIARMRAVGDGLTKTVTDYLCSVVDFLLISHQVSRLKACAEAYEASRVSAEAISVERRMWQAAPFLPAPVESAGPEFV